MSGRFDPKVCSYCGSVASQENPFVVEGHCATCFAKQAAQRRLDNLVALGGNALVGALIAQIREACITVFRKEPQCPVCGTAQTQKAQRPADPLRWS